VLKALGDYLVGLLDFDPTRVIIGRENFEKVNTDDDFITIDYLTTIPLGNTSNYDGDTEKMSIGTLMRYSVTIATVGNNANSTITDIGLKIKSQKSLELQNALNIRVGTPLSVRNLKELSGSIYNDMFEMELNVDVTDSVDVDTLRIDTAQLKINNEKGVIYDGLV
jgi:hypothetical protein